MGVIDRLKIETRSLLVFNHGLGDFCNFLPIFKEINKQAGKRVDIGVQKKRGFHLFYPKAIVTDGIDVKSRYSFIYSVGYREPPEGINKVYHCAYNEFGLSPFNWEPFNLNAQLNNQNSNRVGVHFFGLTGYKKDCKFCPIDVAEVIWKEIISSGFEPFELYQRVHYTKDYFFDNEVPDRFDFATEENSLRFKEPNLLLAIEEIKKCKYVLSVDTGILYLSLMLLGKDSVVGLENQKKIRRFLPEEIALINVKEYEVNSVYKFLKHNFKHGFL